MSNPFAPPADDGSGPRPNASDAGHAESSRTTAPVDHVVCEVCALPHRRDAATCDDCGHVLGRAPDWSSVRGKRASRAGQFVLALVVVVGMLRLDVQALGVVGVLILLVPIFWLFMSGYRYRVFSKALKRSPESSGSNSPIHGSTMSASRGERGGGSE